MSETPSANLFSGTSPNPPVEDRSPAPPRPVSFLIRLLPDAVPQERNHLQWEDESSFCGMVTDVIAANRGKTAAMSKTGLVAQFPDPGAALCAARQVQLATLGFRSFGPRTLPAVAICLFSGGEPSATVPPPADEMGTAALLASAGEAGQILLTEAAGADLIGYLGRNSRSIARLQNTAGRSPGLQGYELLWKEAPGSDGPFSPSKPRQRAEELAGIREQTVASPAKWTGGVIADEPPNSLPAGTGAMRSLERTTTSSSGQTRLPESERRTQVGPVPSRSRWVARVRTIALFVLVAITASVLTSRRDRHLPPSASRPSGPGNVVSTQSPAAVSPTATGPSPQGTSAPPRGSAGSSSPVPPESTPPQSPKGAAALPAPKLPLPSSGDARTSGPAVGRDADGFFRSQIPSLLERADRYSGDGNYAQAERVYRHVLSMEPGNAAAKAGLARIKQAQELEDHQ